MVYFYDSYWGLEDTIYNFNLGLGDTIVDVVPGSYPAITIDSIETIQTTDGLSRKKYVLTDFGYSTEWYIEGVGNNWGILPFYDVQGGPGGPVNLVCFSDHGNLIYHEPGFEADCDVLTSDESVTSINNNISVYPNPFTNQFTVDFGRPIPADIKITDAMGKMIMEKNLGFEESVSISGKDLKNSGVYFLTVKSEGMVITKKIVYSSGIQ